MKLRKNSASNTVDKPIKDAQDPATLSTLLQTLPRRAAHWLSHSYLLLMAMAFVAMAFVSIALAISYRVEIGDGALGLEEEVAAAFAEWQNAEGAAFSAELRDDADTVIGYGDSGRFGPDTLSLTVSRSDSQGRRVEILLSNRSSQLRRHALLHEIGVLLGLSPSNSGVMRQAVPRDNPSEALSPSDIQALQQLGLFVAEDINRDGVVDFYDLIILASNYGGSGVNLEGDINNDGTVDDTDLELLRQAYQFSSPSETPPDLSRSPEAPTPGQLPVGEDDFPDLDVPDLELPDLDVPDLDIPGIDVPDSDAPDTESSDPSEPDGQEPDGQGDAQDDSPIDAPEDSADTAAEDANDDVDDADADTNNNDQ